MCAPFARATHARRACLRLRVEPQHAPARLGAAVGGRDEPGVADGPLAEVADVGLEPLAAEALAERPRAARAVRLP
jgi:hypothetical protein